MSVTSNHVSDEQLKSFVMGTLNFREAVVVKLHALNCEPCMDSILGFYLGKVAAEDERLGEGESPLAHPTKDNILAYVKGETTPEEEDWIAEHCLECDQCDQLFHQLKEAV